MTMQSAWHKAATNFARFDAADRGGVLKLADKLPPSLVVRRTRQALGAIDHFIKAANENRLKAAAMAKRFGPSFAALRKIGRR
jgi:hypothetical protein